MSLPKYLIPLLIIVQAFSLRAGSRPECSPIDVKVEVSKTPQNSRSTLKIVFADKGDYTIKLLDAKGNVTELRTLETSSLAKGEYDLVITDKKSNSDRCPYYQRIKIEGQ